MLIILSLIIPPNAESIILDSNEKGTNYIRRIYYGTVLEFMQQNSKKVVQKLDKPFKYNYS